MFPCCVKMITFPLLYYPCFPPLIHARRASSLLLHTPYCIACLFLAFLPSSYFVSFYLRVGVCMCVQSSPVEKSRRQRPIRRSTAKYKLQPRIIIFVGYVTCLCMYTCRDFLNCSKIYFHHRHIQGTGRKHYHEMELFAYFLEKTHAARFVFFALL